MLAASAERVWQRLQTGEGAEVPTAAAQPIRGCADIRALLAAFHQQQLPAARALIVRDHLRECASCRSYSSGREGGSAASVNWRVPAGARRFQWTSPPLSLAPATPTWLFSLLLPCPPRSSPAPPP